MGVDLCDKILAIYNDHPYFGHRKITKLLQNEGFNINRKRVLRLMKMLNLKAQAPYGPVTTVKKAGDQIYPYLLKDEVICKPHQVWQIDITYIRMPSGFMYLTALIGVVPRNVRITQTFSTAPANKAFC